MAGCDTSVAPAARPSLVDECRRRLTFQERLATLSVVLVLLLWYGVQLGTLYLGWTVTRWQWAFTTGSFPALSPGLVLATISHDPADVTHLLGNVAVLWLFAGESEQHMGSGELVGFFTATALVSVIASSAVTGESTLGASGSALAFVGFYGTHLFLVHRGALELDTSDYGPLDAEALGAYWRAALLLFPMGVLLVTIGQYTAVLPAGRTAVVGHFVGLVLGVAYAIGRQRTLSALSRT